MNLTTRSLCVALVVTGLPWACSPGSTPMEDAMPALLAAFVMTKSSNVGAEDEYACMLADDSTTMEGFDYTTVVSESSDSVKYASFADLGSTRKNEIAIIEPQSP